MGRLDPRGQRLVRSGTTGRASFNVPAAVARLVSPSARFHCELVDEGILFRYIDGQEPPPKPPAWVRS